MLDLTYACGECGVGDKARFTHAPVAAHGVHTVSIWTHSLQLALIQICGDMRKHMSPDSSQTFTLWSQLLD